MYIPKYFKVKELIGRYTYEKYGHKGDAWMLGIMFDERLLRVIDNIRDQFGPMTINDWAWGGNFHFSGYRSPGCDTGADLSQHRFGRAVDMKPKDCTAKEVRADIINFQNMPEWKVIGGLEMGISWLHVDVRTRNVDGEICLFYP